MFRSIAFAMSLAMGAGAASAQDVSAQDASAGPEDTILIMDASGSMWGQIDGVNKIVIAKDVMEGLIRSIPEERRLGLVAYGHRKKGDCKDIETLADVGAERAKLIDQVRALSPTGKTPLSSSVLHAAEDLNYTRNKSTVILVSDGKETCDVDPCELGRMLEENGLDFTVHVVGFDVTEEERTGLQCIAEETGGVFLAADNAEELTDALAQVALTQGEAEPSEAESESVPSTLALKATILNGGPLIQSNLNWTVLPAEGGDPVFTAEDAGAVETEVLPGDYSVTVVWTGWAHGGEKTGMADFTVNPQQPKVMTIPVDLALPLTLDAPVATAEGVGFDVTWSGPDDLGTTIAVNRLDDSPRELIYFAAGAKARAAYEKAARDKAALDTDGDGDFDMNDLATTAIGGPSVAGDYEVRYILNDPRVILARRPITVTDSDYTLSIPEEVPAATAFDVEWDGPLTDGDFVTLIEAGSEKIFQNGSTARLKEGQPATLTTPATPGDYEVRYILANGYTLYPGMQQVVQASAPLKVTAVEASLSAPATAVGGSTIDVVWEGPDGWEDDFISVIEPGAEKPNRDSRDRLADRGEPRRPAGIRVPAIPGEYELAYFLQPGAKILARIPITITQAEAMVDAPDTVKAGESFVVKYSGDGFSGDRIVVVSADTPDSKMWSTTIRYGFAAAADGKEGTVTDYPISAGPGEYEARYVTGLQHQVIARDKFTVVE
ncbi:MAG: vWA domain-containing protein [Alphaproteobacteria bacterium]